MKVVFLQHNEQFRPGRLQDYLVRRHQADITTLKLHENPGVREEATSGADLIVSLGSPVPVVSTDVEWVTRERQLLSHALTRGIPVLGICFGAQMLSVLAGGSVSLTDRPHVGWLENDAVASPVWKGPWFRFHKEQCHPPPDAQILACSLGTVQAFRHGAAVGVQFHPEMEPEIVEDLVPSMRRDFDLTVSEADELVQESRARVDKLGETREALFTEILGCRGR